MGSEPTTVTGKPSANLVAIVAVGVIAILSILGQTAWLGCKIDRLGTNLDGKIDRLGTNLGGKIDRLEHRLGLKLDSLQRGQIEIRERLAGVESRLGAVENRLAGVENRLGAMENRGGASPSAVAQVEAGA